ncbi:MAG TPA: proline dehydrogenase family protein [Gemmatimonadales bacterium]|nr:proline dehydrogenase family protein [Gemmatimonadales bacterium]
MMRSILFWLSERKSIFNFVRRNRMARGMASRFVAGETVEEAVAAAIELNGRGITTTLDLLGESVTSFDDVDIATRTYLEILDRQHAAGIEANASLKLTQFGLDLDEARCEAHVRQIVTRAESLGGFIRLDMEGSEYTERTLAFHRRLAVDHAASVGVVIQSALRRSTADVEALNASGTRVRLCKGAYLESDALAFPDKSDVDAHYVRLMQLLLTSRAYHGLATHDEVIIEQAKQFVTERGIPRDHFEFQMLYGVRRDLQDALVAEGWRIRVYIPFGTHWYPYLMRRLAERPANIFFIVGNIFKEGKRRT